MVWYCKQCKAKKRGKSHALWGEFCNVECTVKHSMQEKKAALIKSVENLGQEKRQLVLDGLNGGNTLGDVSRDHNLELDQVCEILNQNIAKVQYLVNIAK
jgi:hypothetical protein